MGWFWDRLTEPLVIFGFAGQFVFMLRFLVQWFASERRGKSYVPLAFWYISIGGGLMLLAYGVFDHDPVIVLGQTLGLFIYLRNLFLIYNRRARYQRRRQALAADAARVDADPRHDAPTPSH